MARQVAWTLQLDQRELLNPLSDSVGVAKAHIMENVIIKEKKVLNILSTMTIVHWGWSITS